MPPKVSDAYKEQKRAQLLQHAFECFARKGYSETTIDDICTQAKVSKGAIYSYFRSKEEIFLQLLESRNEAYLLRSGEQFAAMTGSASAKIRLLIDSARNVAERDDSRIWGNLQLEFLLYASRNNQLQHLIDRQYERFMSFYEEIMREGVRTGEFRADLDTHLAASLFWKLLTGTTTQFGLMSNEHQHNETLLEAERLIFGYLIRREERSS